jgi:hypothetical protein
MISIQILFFFIGIYVIFFGFTEIATGFINTDIRFSQREDMIHRGLMWVLLGTFTVAVAFIPLPIL